MGKGCVLCPPVWPKNKQTSDAIFSVINDIKLKEMAPKDVVSQDDAQWFIAAQRRHRQIQRTDTGVLSVERKKRPTRLQ